MGSSGPVRDAAYIAREALAAAGRLLAELADDGISVGAIEDAEAVGLAYHDREVRRVPAPVVELVSALAEAVAEARSDDGIGGTAARRLADAIPAVREAPTGTYDAPPCDAGGRGTAACGSTTRVLLAPEQLSGVIHAPRRGWWHAECSRCRARFLWRPEVPPGAPGAAPKREAPAPLSRGPEAARLRAALVALDNAAFVRVSGNFPAGTAAHVLLEAAAPGDRPALLAYEAASAEAHDAARALLDAVDPEGETADVPAWTPPADASREEAWSVTLRGADLDLLDALAAARNQASPDAFGVLGHCPDIVRDALSIGLRALARRTKNQAH